MDRGKGELYVGKSCFSGRLHMALPYRQASVLHWLQQNMEPDPNTQKFQKNTIYYDKTQYAHFQVSAFFKLQKHLSGEKWDVGYLSAFDWAVLLCCFGVQVFMANEM